MSLSPSVLELSSNEIAGADLVELYFERGWTDGLPVDPPTPAKVNAVVRALGGDPDFIECQVAPRWGALTREVLAINIVMAGCKPEYAPVVRAAMLALTDRSFNLNGVQAMCHFHSLLDFTCRIWSKRNAENPLSAIVNYMREQVKAHAQEAILPALVTRDGMIKMGRYAERS